MDGLEDDCFVSFLGFGLSRQVRLTCSFQGRCLGLAIGPIKISRCGWWLGPILGGAEVWGYHPKEDGNGRNGVNGGRTWLFFFEHRSDSYNLSYKKQQVGSL